MGSEIPYHTGITTPYHTPISTCAHAHIYLITVAHIAIPAATTSLLYLLSSGCKWVCEPYLLTMFILELDLCSFFH